MKRYFIQIEDLHGTHFFGGFCGLNGRGITYAHHHILAVRFVGFEYALITAQYIADLMDSWGLDGGVFVVEVDQ